MLSSIVSSVTLVFAASLAQEFVFPDDQQLVNLPTSDLAQIASNLSRSQEGSAAVYEKYVDEIISRGVLKFALEMQKAITDSSSGRSEMDNIVYSPVSIAGALALILLGANGKTFTEISTVLGLATGVDIAEKSQLVHEQIGRMFQRLDISTGYSNQQSSSIIKIASAIFVQNDYPIREQYKRTSLAIYKSEIINLDFRTNSIHAMDTVNAWVSDRTNGKIVDVLTVPPPADTKIIIASALYFNSAWEYPFIIEATRKKLFYTNGRDKASKTYVDMMANGGEFPYYKDTVLDCQIIGLPYKGNRTVMYIVLPSDSNKQKLAQLESRLSATELERLISNTKWTPSIVLLPKMKITTSLNLNDALSNLGVKSLFNPAESNLALLSPGVDSNIVKVDIENLTQINTRFGGEQTQPVQLITHIGEEKNCSEIFKSNSTINVCANEISNTTGQSQVIYKRFGNKIGRRIVRQTRSQRLRHEDTLDYIRKTLNNDTSRNHNPGLYADKVIHKVYIDITETGTEAAAVTTAILTRDGDKAAIRADVPFLFFIRNEDTKLVLFWGSVTKPTPNYS